MDEELINPYYTKKRNLKFYFCQLKISQIIPYIIKSRRLRKKLAAKSYIVPFEQGYTD